MDKEDITVPARLALTCPDCEELRIFRARDSSVEEKEALYKCNECGHTVLISM